jgi:hypothetical protein
MNIIDMSLRQGAGGGGFPREKTAQRRAAGEKFGLRRREIDPGRRGRQREQEQSGEGKWIMPLPEV